MVEQVNVALAGQEKSPEQVKHDEEMAKVAEGNQGDLSIDNKDGEKTVVQPEGAPAVAERPAEIPEKFWDAEKGEVNTAALLKSQQDGEKALREKGIEPVEETPEVKPEGDQAPNAVTTAQANYDANGKLEESDYTALAGVGMDRASVDAYIAGQKAIISGLQTAAAEPFGGELENFNAAAEWAVDNLTKEEIAALDVQLTSTNAAIVKQGAVALQAKHAAGADIAPNVTIQGDAAASASGTSFRSSAEMQKAMSDPRYKNDESYRAEVAGKISRSNQKLFG